MPLWSLQMVPLALHSARPMYAMVCGGLALWEKNKDMSYTPRVRETFDLAHQGGGGVFEAEGIPNSGTVCTKAPRRREGMFGERGDIWRVWGGGWQARARRLRGLISCT